jgi:hypothetical protein
LFTLDEVPNPCRNVNVQKYSLKQFAGTHTRESEGLTPPIDVLPARMTAEQVACFLGFSVEAMPVLVKAKLLEPLAEPVPNAQKYFAKVYIVTLASNVEWLDRATQAIYDHWEKKNERKTVNLAPAMAA